ncbi:hypothetical protein PENTCL1PPCAC_11653, partial [Pristionchus entomophagus]
MNGLIVMMLTSGFSRGGGIRDEMAVPPLNQLSSQQQFELFCFNMLHFSCHLVWDISIGLPSVQSHSRDYFVQDYEKRFSSSISQLLFIIGMHIFYGMDLLIENFISSFALVIFSLAFHMIFNFITIPIVHRINLKYVDINSSLSRKFTVAENVKTTGMIFPVFILWLTSQWILL